MLKSSYKNLSLLISGILLIALLVACGGNSDNGLGDVSSSETLSGESPSTTHPDGVMVTLTNGDPAKIGLGSVPREVFLSGEEGGELALALAALPPYLDMKSPLYIIGRQDNSEGGEFRTEIVIPNGAEPFAMIDLYTWDIESGKWVFVPAKVDEETGNIVINGLPSNLAVFHVTTITPLISTILEPDETLDPDIAAAMNMVFPAGLLAQPDGALSGVLASGWQTGSGYAVMPLVRGDGATVSSIINNQATRALHIQDLANYAVNSGFNGIAVDYKLSDEADTEAFNTFINELAGVLYGQNKLLAVVLPKGGNYDRAAIGQAADIVLLSPGMNPRNYAADGSYVEFVGKVTDEISRLKLHVVSSSLSIARLKADSNYVPITYDEALAPLGVVKVKGGIPDEGLFEPGTELKFELTGQIDEFAPDPKTGAYTYKTPTDETTDKIWIITANALRARLDILASLNIGGVGLYHINADGNDAGVLTALNEFKASTASSINNQLAMQWSVSDGNTEIASANVGLDETFTWETSEEGDYVINAVIVGGRVSDRGDVDVKVGEPEPEETETPEPTYVAPVDTSSDDDETPTDEPTPAATEPPPPPPPSGGSGSDGGGFEYGGQVPSSLVNAGRMQGAGMKWVKFQAKWPYVGADVAGSWVQSGHAAGFKVLLSIPGPLYPTSIDYGAYIAHLQAVAAYQPDAIEIWNEMNLDREWPAGQIDPNSYVTNMLAPAFNTIKGVSPGTMVIIGALAPTGFDNGTNAWSDWRYLQGLAAAGAANYANCVGAHHNSGTTSPSAREGHVSDDGGLHYSWYFLPTIEVTYNGLGGALPVCITEFGYVSGEGYPPLPAAFSWGAGNTVAEQAAWLAEGVTLSRSLGWVRFLIVWNIDFTTYDSDPQAGYAIIRPDGSCPACDALAGVAN